MDGNDMEPRDRLLNWDLITIPYQELRPGFEISAEAGNLILAVRRDCDDPEGIRFLWGAYTYLYAAQIADTVRSIADRCPAGTEKGEILDYIFPRLLTGGYADFLYSVRERSERILESLQEPCGVMSMERSRSDIGALLERISELEARVCTLECGIRAYLEGYYPNPRDHRPNKCQHGTNYWDECVQCDCDHFYKLLNPSVATADEPKAK